jgi:hypothetical protein
VSVLRFAAALIAFISLPAQTRQASSVSVEHLAPCAGLSDAECCEWTVRTASFKVTREQMPEASARAVRLVCADKQQIPTQSVCKAIALTRGFCAREADLICEEKKTDKLCAKNAPCAECAQKLRKLGYRQAYWACRAATYATEKKPEEQTVIVVEEVTASGGKTDATRTVIKRRRKLQ